MTKNCGKEPQNVIFLYIFPTCETCRPRNETETKKKKCFKKDLAALQKQF